MILQCWKLQSQLTGGYCLSFQELENFATQLGFLQFPEWSRYTLTHTPETHSLLVPLPTAAHFLSLVEKGMGMQRYSNICKSNIMDASEHLNRAS